MQINTNSRSTCNKACIKRYGFRGIVFLFSLLVLYRSYQIIIVLQSIADESKNNNITEQPKKGDERKLRKTSSNNNILHNNNWYDHCKEGDKTAMTENNNYSGKPLWIPAYPGSGSEMMRSVVRAVTGGQGAGEIYGGDGGCHESGVVTCKTHWPYTRGMKTIKEPIEMKDQFHSRYVLLVRNPMNALPSHFNYKFEDQSGLKSHTEQAPEQRWIQWRDRKFQRELDDWKNHLVQWKKKAYNNYYERSMILVYEDLIDYTKGPKEIIRLTAEMKRVGVTGMTPAIGIPCLWYDVVKRKKKETKRAHSYVPGYTEEQKNAFLQTLRDLKDNELSDDSQIVTILDNYIQDIQQNIRVS